MPYFDCLVIGSWAFAFGWFFGAIYVQNHKEKKEQPQVAEKLEQCLECQGWRLPVGVGAAAD